MAARQTASATSISRVTCAGRPNSAKTVGVAPMEYLTGWRMAVARDLLRQQDCAVADVAERVGYGSASTFSTAFSRYVGQPPSHYARAGLSA